MCGYAYATGGDEMVRSLAEAVVVALRERMDDMRIAEHTSVVVETALRAVLKEVAAEVPVLHIGSDADHIWTSCPKREANALIIVGAKVMR
jgi:hypothetical protein